jgi:transcription elongation GreA/GreB family factor
MSKALVRDAIIAQLTRELSLQTRAAQDSRDEATSPENKAEGQYDMRAQEAAYLAEGQARLSAELAEAITLFQALEVAPLPAHAPVVIGALVTLEAHQRHTHYFVGPRRGGLEASAGELAFTVVTPSSPLGRQLVGKTLGATVTLPDRRGVSTHRIHAIT